jgi:putative tricarboxylic transport membrane protein
VSAPSSSRSGSRSSEIAFSLGVLALGVGAALVTASLPSEGGYAGIGPNFVPALVSGGLAVLGLWLLGEALTGGWRQRAPQADRFEKRPFAWISAGLFAHMALVGAAGFVIAGAVLFTCVARGFGSRRFLSDLGIGVALTLAIYLFFTQFLNVSLPAGWMLSRP